MLLARTVPILAIALALTATVAVQAGPLPPEARAAIHTLLDNHESIERTVTLTEEGYVAVTESDDPAVAAVLREHVEQMGARLAEGLMVRRWDPAFAEYVRHYDELTHRLEPTERGLRMAITGSTPQAIAVARNHARVIVDFVEQGWAAHDRTHAAVSDGAAAEPRAEAGRGCGRGRRAGRGAGRGPGRGQGRGGCCGGCGAGS